MTPTTCPFSDQLKFCSAAEGEAFHAILLFALRSDQIIMQFLEETGRLRPFMDGEHRAKLFKDFLSTLGTPITEDDNRTLSEFINWFRNRYWGGERPYTYANN